MTIDYQFGGLDAHGANIRLRAMASEAEHQSIIRDVLGAGDFWGGAGSVSCQQFITDLGRNFHTVLRTSQHPLRHSANPGQQDTRHRLRGRSQLRPTAPTISTTAKGGAAQ